MNVQGDTTKIFLEYTYDSEPIEDVADITEIVLQLNNEGQTNALTFKLSDSSIDQDSGTGKYFIKLTQAQSIALGRTIRYQVSIMTTDGSVYSSDIGSMTVGELLRTSAVASA